MKSILAIAALGLLLAGCQSEQSRVNPATHTWQTDQGTRALDHVSGNDVDASKAVIRRYLGEPYYFESEANARTFDANPGAYLYQDNNPERSASPGQQGVRVR
jgi:YHS domain-containing protein